MDKACFIFLHFYLHLHESIDLDDLLNHFSNIHHIVSHFLILVSYFNYYIQESCNQWWNSKVVYYDQGGFEGRTSIRLYEWFYTDISSEGYPTQKYKVFKFNIILTSFEVFCSDLYNVFLEVPFRWIVIDEAHRLKNKAGKTLTLLKEHPWVRVFLLTGTPVQNNTKELFTLLNYIEPLRFRSMDLLLEKFGDLK